MRILTSSLTLLLALRGFLVAFVAFTVFLLGMAMTSHVPIP
jgi:hypothetical protein